MLWSAAPHIEQCIVTPMFGSFLQSILIPFLLWIFLSKITPFQTKSFLHNNPQQNPSPITPEKGPMPFTTVLISHITLTKDGHLPREIEDAQAPQPYPGGGKEIGMEEENDRATNRRKELPRLDVDNVVDPSPPPPPVTVPCRTSAATALQ